MNLDPGYRIRAVSGEVFRTIQWLGKGGNSVVYLVQATEGPIRGVLFALKIFLQIDKPDRQKRFNQEVSFLSGAKHPSIMRVFDKGDLTYEFGTGVGSYPFVVNEYLPRGLDLLIRQNTATTAEKVTYVVQLLSALNYLHTQHEAVIHRDLKPANIFVKGNSCILGDFGLMKILQAKETREEVVSDIENATIGMARGFRTPDMVAYISHKTPLTPATDIYQLGLLVAQLFTNRNPQIYTDKIRSKVKLEEIRFIPGSAVGKTIKASIQSMLADEPKDRPSALELYDEWDGIFNIVINRSHELNGKVFLPK